MPGLWQGTYIQDLLKTLNNLSVGNTAVAQILTSDDYSLLEKIEAFRTASESLTGIERDAFQELYQDLNTFNQAFSDELLEMIDLNGISIESINNIGQAIQNLGYTTEEATDRIAQLFNQIYNGEDLSKAIQDVFSDSLSNFDTSTEAGYQDWLKAYNKVLNAYADAIGVSMLNMSQNLTSFTNTINSFYAKAGEWSSMKASERIDFMSDNAELFTGEQGAALRQALESGDYRAMYAALQGSTTLQSQREQQLRDIENAIAIEMAKVTEQRNYAYIEELEQQKKLLQNEEELFMASLEVRLEQEQQYLDEYKSYLEDQRDALKESLDKRKEAYSDYFDTVNKMQDEEEFNDKENLLIANITKLATSNTASAVNQITQLEQERKTLEQERLATLRQEAQDSIMQNIDHTIESIDKKFDQLLNSQQALLSAMTNELDDPADFLSNLIVNKVQEEGLTQLGLESYIRDLQTTYGSVIGSNIFDQIQVKQEGDKLVLNINGQENITLSGNDQQTIYDAITTALKQVGLR